MNGISGLGKFVSLMIVVVIIFFIYITAVNNASLLGRLKLEAQTMRNDLRNEYNELATDSSNTSSQTQALSMRKGKMIPIDISNNAEYTTLNTLQNKQNPIPSEDSKPQNSGIIVK